MIMKKLLVPCIAMLFSCAHMAPKPIERIGPESEGLYTVELSIPALDSIGQGETTLDVDPERLCMPISLNDTLPASLIQEGDGELTWKCVLPGTIIKDSVFRLGKAVVTEIRQTSDDF